MSAVQFERLEQATRSQDLLLDPVMGELNEKQRSEILQDADFSGAQFNSKTQWPAALGQRSATQQ